MRFWITYGATVFIFAYLVTQLVMVENGKADGVVGVLIPFVLSVCVAAIVVSIGIFGSSSHSGYGGGG